MHRAAIDRRADQPVLSVMFRTFGRDVRIRCPDQGTAEQLAFIGCRPEIEGAARSQLDLDVEAIHGFLRLETPGGVAVEGSAAVILDELYRLRFEMVRAERHGALFLRGGTVTTDAGHILFAGEAGAGKSTLLLHLADLGWPVTGDDWLIVKGDVASPFPNSLRVRSGALSCLSARAADIVRSSPRTSGWFGQPTYAIEPSAFGHPWVVRSRPLLHVILVEGNHGGSSRLQPLDRTIAMEEIFKALLLPTEARARSLAEFNALMASANCWRCSLGRLDDAVRLLQELTNVDGLHGSLEVRRASKS